MRATAAAMSATGSLVMPRQYALRHSSRSTRGTARKLSRSSGSGPSSCTTESSTIRPTRWGKALA
jgi:hypothetical protein